MTENNRKGILFIISIVVLILSFVFGVQINSLLDDIEFCKSCHEMQPYYNSFMDPSNGSLIATHNLTCIQCHSNKSISDAKKNLVIEIIFHRLKLSSSQSPSLSGLKTNCLRCHFSLDIIHTNMNNVSVCTDCHKAHQEVQETKVINLKVINNSPIPYIPLGPHINQTCFKCHGTNYDYRIPSCIDCHTGHGGQLFENELCLKCHIDPHVPVKISNKTSKFNEELPFSVCEPCHEDEYLDLISSYSNHTARETCTICHNVHGKKPQCSDKQCHPKMGGKKSVGLHETIRRCSSCHLTYKPELIRCKDCHGSSHAWSSSTAIMNPK